MRTVIKYSILWMVMSSLFSCVTNRDMHYLQAIEADFPNYKHQDYIIKAGDEIALQVFSTNPDVVRIFTPSRDVMTGADFSTYKVYADGTIDLPFISKIEVAGKTLREAQEQIKTLFKDYVNVDFAINMIVSNRYFYVIGKSNSKGQFPYYKEQMNIFEALALAGNLSVTADRRKIKIIRTEGDKETIVKFDLRSKKIIDSDYYYIRPDDIIVVNESPSTFFKITSYTGVLGTITSTLSFILLVLQ